MQRAGRGPPAFTRPAAPSGGSGLLRGGGPDYPQEIALGVEERVQADRHAPLHYITAPYEAGPIGLAGSHQPWNAALAVGALALALRPDAERMTPELAHTVTLRAEQQRPSPGQGERRLVGRVAPHR